MSRNIIYLSQSDVIRGGGMSMDLAIQDLEEVYRLYDKGDYLLPGKIVMKWPGENSEETIGRINAMPGYIGGSYNMSGIKWIGSGPHNPFKYGLPRASAIIVLNDPETMIPIAIMDGAVISAIRTGAVTGICSKYLAPVNAKTVGLLGAGVQNRTQLLAIKTALPQIEQALIYDISEQRCKAFAEDMCQRLNMKVRVESNKAKLIEVSDILVTATTATEPLVHGRDIQRGCYLAHIGGNEVDEELILKADKIVVDDWETDKHRMGDTLAYMYRDGKVGDDKIYGSVSDLVCGNKPGRTSADELTYSCNVGLSIYDVALATRVYRNALAKNIGQYLELWDEPALV